jgi:hypothetical protein
MKTYGGSGGIAPPCLTSVLDGGEWSASRLCRFTPGGKSPRYPLYMRLGGPQSRSGLCGEDTNVSVPGIEPAVQPVTRRYTD